MKTPSLVRLFQVFALVSAPLCLWAADSAPAAQADSTVPPAAPATTSASVPAAAESSPSAAKEEGQVARDKAMGPDVKLANLFRYQAPPMPMAVLPRVTPIHGQGPSIVIERSRDGSIKSPSGGQ
ncbi:hypothetical protein H5P28_01370 [Ruficoccus amylovorans]|uniref:Uncharacterized protein n=1 Tax=Ruficoccus amylovorans TaxID=1804625 RepID=A0A842H9U1_9BACT|nr:hypothetical protein [Ruficoccus amylovorans]MBC2592899.1 hypothetical protein [Ruficoccus amylovorans]